MRMGFLDICLSKNAYDLFLMKQILIFVVVLYIGRFLKLHLR